MLFLLHKIKCPPAMTHTYILMLLFCNSHIECRRSCVDNRLGNNYKIIKTSKGSNNTK